MSRKYIDVMSKILSKCKIDINTGCLLYQGAVGAKGYGTIHIDKNSYRIHRYSYEYHKGPIPDGLFVCHSCDRPNCVNPQHLWVGTAADNNADRDSKGRGNWTDRFRGATLYEPDVIEIYNSTNSIESLAKEWCVTERYIKRIKKKQCWKELLNSLSS